MEAQDNEVGLWEYLQSNIHTRLTIIIKVFPGQSFPCDLNKSYQHKLDSWELNQQNYRREACNASSYLSLGMLGDMSLHSNFFFLYFSLKPHGTQHQSLSILKALLCLASLAQLFYGALLTSLSMWPKFDEESRRTFSVPLGIHNTTRTLEHASCKMFQDENLLQTISLYQDTCLME